MNSKQLKYLAEAHFFAGKKLTDDEYNMLTESKYAHLIKKRGKFDEIFESTLPASEEVNYELPKAYQKRKYTGFNLGINKHDVDHLIDMVEDQFNLGIDNTSTRKFMSVNIDQLKKYILAHVDEEGLDNGTKERIHAIVNKPDADVYDIMKGLYALGY